MFNFNNRTGQEILKDWKKIRKSISTLDNESKIQEVVDFWKTAPLVNFVLNYNEYAKWPSAWEIIDDNIYDSISIAYVMAMTLVFSGYPEKDIIMKYVKPNDETDYIMVIILDNSTVLNYSYGEIVDIKDASWTKTLITLHFIDKKIKEK